MSRTKIELLDNKRNRILQPISTLAFPIAIAKHANEYIQKYCFIHIFPNPTLQTGHLSFQNEAQTLINNLLNHRE